MKKLLFLCFFFSGATSLVLQIVWTKELSYILGNTLYAMATVVAAFMAGLGIGSLLSSVVSPRLERPVLWYAFVQVGIALLGAVSVFVFRGTVPLFSTLYGSLGSGGAFLLARFTVVTVLMLVPVTLMGVTLPLIVGALARAKESYAFEAGLAYGINTLGAVAGTWAAGFLLIPSLGLAGSAFTAAGIDAVVAAIAFFLAGRLPTAAPAPASGPEARAGRWTSRQWFVGLAFLASGAVAMVLEVAWFRLLGLTMGPTVYVFAAMLGTYLLGVGAGSAIFARWARGTRMGGLGGLAFLEVVLGLIVLGSMQMINSLPRWNSSAFLSLREALGLQAFAVSHIVVAAIVVLAPCLVMGAAFPMAVRAIREGGDDTAPEANVGRLYLLNTIGGIAGSLVGGFVLLPALGISSTIVGAGVGSAIVGAVLVLGGIGRSVGFRAGLGGAAVAVAIAAAVVAPGLDIPRFNLGLYREVYAASRFDVQRLSQAMLFYAEGVNAPVSVFNTGEGTASLRVSGKTDASTQPDDVRTQMLLGHLTTLVARDPRRAAVIGYGCGATAGAVLTHPTIESVDVIEIEQGVIDASPYFDSINGSPFEDSRTRLILEDGRTHMTYTDQEYDVVVSEPSNPWMAGVANLFTIEFYERVRDRLAPGGVFGQWIQNYEISRETFRTMLATVTTVFPETLVFSTGPGDVLVVGSVEPIRVSFEELRARFGASSVRESFATVDIPDVQTLAFYLYGSTASVRRFVAEVRTPNTDDNAWLEYRMPLDLMSVSMIREAGIEGVTPPVREIPARLLDERYLRDLAEVFQGLPVADTARAVAKHLYAEEPVFGYGDDLVHPLWRPLEDSIVTALRAEAENAGERSLREAVEQSLGAGKRRFDTRCRNAGTLDRLLGEGRLPDLPALTSIARGDRDFAWVHVLLGRLHFEAGRFADAQATFEIALNRPMSTYRSLAYRGAAESAEKKGSVEEARALLAKASAENPYDPEIVLAYADLLARTGQSARAREVVEEGLRLNPRAPSVRAAATAMGISVESP